MMENQFEKKFPKGTLSFYVKIYCKRKGQSKKKCTEKEALKSWISLNKSEKEFFEKKYYAYKDNYKKRIALYLKNAEPYLQQNETTVNGNGIDTSDKESNQNELMPSSMEVDDNINQDSSPQDDQSNTPIMNTTLQDEVHFMPEPVPSKVIDEVQFMPEPIPPKVTTSKELFLKLKENEETWDQLTEKQKTFYRKAVLMIKRNYLQQYRKYLELLSSEELFHHYQKTMNSTD